ncbi:caspase family protein [Curvivirga sp.]|uniref:caspase family protein n=1 Tax=Curvivirga sp. TaxID=2856848 RepID=UPI003B5A1D11
MKYLTKIPSASFKKGLLICGFSAFLSGCVVYTVFGVGKEFNDAYLAGNWSQAALVYESDPAFFKQNADLAGFTPQLDHIAQELNKNLASRLEVHRNKLDSQVWPQRAEDWVVTKNFLEESETILTEYNQYSLLKEPQYRNTDFDVYAKDLETFRDQITDTAPEAFADFDHFDSKDFFKEYPVFLAKSKFISANFDKIEDDITNANVAQFETFLGKYALNKELVSATAAKVEKAYLNALVMEKTGGRDPDLMETWEIYQSAENKGIKSRKYLRDSITMIEIPSRDRIGQTAIDFPISVEKEKNVLNRSINLEKVLSDDAVQNARYVVIVDLAAAISTSKDQGKTKSQSRYYTHSDWLPNPDYAAAQQEVNAAQLGLQQAQAAYQQALQQQQLNSYNTGYDSGWGAVFASAVTSVVSISGVTSAEERLNEANNRLANTPIQVEHKRYTPYQYQRVTVGAEKQASVNYFVLDRSTNKYVQGTLSKKNNKSFIVLEDLNQQDPDLSSIKKGAVTRDELANWLEEPETVTFDDVIADYRQRRRQGSKLPADVLVQQDLFDQRNKAIKVALANTSNKQTTVVEAAAVTAKTTNLGYGRITDYNFPRGKVNNDAYAVLVGVRDYDNKDIPPVDFALNDADAIKQYLIKTRGFKEENVIVLENPNQSDLMSHFGSESNHKGKLYDSVTRRGMKDIFVFYSGHGIPTDEGTGVMLPKDADPQKPEFTGYALSTLVKNLNKLNNVNITLAVDACFSGVSAGGTLVKSASPLYLGSNSSSLTLTNGTIFTAADGKEIASWDTDVRLGLFTKHLLEGFVGKADKVGNKDGKVNVAEMLEYLRDAVGEEADRRFNRRQTPQVFGNTRAVVNEAVNHDFETIQALMKISN